MLAKIALNAVLASALLVPLAGCNEDADDSTTAESTTAPVDSTTGTATSGTTEPSN